MHQTTLTAFVVTSMFFSSQQTACADPVSGFTFELGGRVMFDVARFSSDRDTLADDHEIRRIRIEADGKLFNELEYDISIEDFTNSDYEIKNAYLMYSPVEQTSLLLGQHKEPFSLEELTSSKNITFMERALPNVFAPGRNLGVSLRHVWERWTVNVGVFGESLEDYHKDDDSSQWDLTGRISYKLLTDNANVVHAGLAVSRHDTGTDHKVKFSTRPEAHLSSLKFANTGNISDTQTVWKYGTELLVIANNLSFQAEYLLTDLVRDAGNDDLRFDGWYSYASWVVTGESRRYKARKATPGSIKPAGKWGAWELAIRYSELNLNDLATITGGRERNVSFGINWYINRWMRLMANYIKVSNDRFADDDGDAFAIDPQIYQMRLQIAF